MRTENCNFLDGGFKHDAWKGKRDRKGASICNFQTFLLPHGEILIFYTLLSLQFLNFNKVEQDAIEEQYLNLTAYSNNLIRTGAIPSHDDDKRKTTGGIYYSVTKKYEEGEEVDEEALESIAKRRAVIKDSWDFYRMLCSLLRDRRKYDEAFRRLQLDPVYPYLNSMSGLNDPGDDANSSEEVMQKDLPQYATMTRSAVCKDLMDKANLALPSLVEICKALAGSLGMEEVGIGKYLRSAPRGCYTGAIFFS